MSNKKNHEMMPPVTPSEAVEIIKEHVGSDATSSMTFDDKNRFTITSVDDTSKRVECHEFDKPQPHIHIKEDGADGTSEDEKDKVYPIVN